ncbi:PRC-barrel domain-containing protein [Streptomyces sp. NPDC086783]|uniref:PRC-barrel domain-containing protein n=1 Tax=Streptomyces sp. NPDC086783 TaxID=3365758 RepID=UPI003812CC18
MITREQISTVLDHPVHDAEGNKIGDAKHVFLDDVTGRPEWVSVKTGLFGTSESFVPIQDAAVVEDHLEVPYSKDKVKDAPNVDVDAGGHLSVQEEHHLYEYYGLAWDAAWQQANQPDEGGWAHAGATTSPDTSTVGAPESRYEDTTASGIARSGEEHPDTATPQSGYDDTTASGIARSGKEQEEGTVAAGSKRPGDRDASTGVDERMRGTERGEAERARLRQYYITDEQQGRSDMP